MNSLQIDYLNALNNAKRIESEVALNSAKITEASGRSQLLSTQASGQRLSNREAEAKLSNLQRRVLNDKYRLDMDNAMLFNTVDWWVNGGKKLSNNSNRRWNPYWNTQGNMGREFQNVVSGIKDVLSIPWAAVGNPKISYNATTSLNTLAKGFINN